MAGLGLSNAVQMYREGKEWRQRQDTQREQDAEAKRRKADLEYARSQGSAVLDRYRSEYDAANPVEASVAHAADGSKPSGMTLGAAAASTGVAAPAAAVEADPSPGLSLGSVAGQTAPAAATVPAKPRRVAYQPSDAHVLEAMEASTRAMGERLGFDAPEFQKSWTHVAGVRDRLRTDALNRLETTMRGGGDITDALKTAYRYIDDGHSLTNVELTKDMKSGAPMYQITRVGRDGKEVRSAVSPEALKAQIAWASDPSAVRKYEVDRLTAEYKDSLERRRDKEKVGAETAKDLTVEEARQKGRVALAEQGFQFDVNKLRIGGAITRQNATHAARADGGKAPSGYQWTADGKSLEPIPGGPAALKAAGGGDITEGERNAGGYASRMTEASNILDQFEKTGRATFKTNVAGAVPVVGATARTAVSNPDQQRYRQAQEDWVRAKLRKESGAAIAKDEMDAEIATYFPTPADSPELVAQKRSSREVANRAMVKSAGRGFSQQEAIDVRPEVAKPTRGGSTPGRTGPQPKAPDTAGGALSAAEQAELEQLRKRLGR